MGTFIKRKWWVILLIAVGVLMFVLFVIFHNIGILIFYDVNYPIDLKIITGEIKHITKLEVNKDGIEGAAATIIPVPGKSGSEKEYKKILNEFVVDKQFGFVLTFNNSILFSGIVSYAN